MKKLLVGALIAGLLPVAALAAEAGTGPEAVALTKKFVEYLKTTPKDKAYSEVTAGDPRFIDRDLYVLAIDKNGKCVAHGINPKIVGKDSSENQDADGVYYVKDRLEKAKASKEFWQDYKFVNPTTKKIEPKSTYCEVVSDGDIVCVGFYKK